MYKTSEAAGKAKPATQASSNDLSDLANAGDFNDFGDSAGFVNADNLDDLNVLSDLAGLDSLVSLENAGGLDDACSLADFARLRGLDGLAKPKNVYLSLQPKHWARRLLPADLPELCALAALDAPAPVCAARCFAGEGVFSRLFFAEVLRCGEAFGLFCGRRLLAAALFEKRESAEHEGHVFRLADAVLFGEKAVLVALLGEGAELAEAVLSFALAGFLGQKVAARCRKSGPKAFCFCCARAFLPFGFCPCMRCAPVFYA